ncbi:hypothetical protein BS78_05G014500 [Paspalum vaginatum]|nr:hypothetical protein BS78_05G014500 [Paspalum vaginatum]
MACVPAADRERAVKEVAQAYERIKVQQPLLLLHHHCSGDQLLAHSLLGEAMRALEVALAVMKQQQPALAQPPSPRPDDHYKATVSTTARRGSKRQRSSSSSVAMEEAAGNKNPSSSRVSLSTMPYDDGYVWRKYGEKTINGTSYTRSYFRCTYKYDTGCQATKHVQQQAGGNHTDPPVFQVTYNNEHTCNSSSQAAAMPPLIQDSDDEYQTPLLSSQEPLLLPVISMQQFCTETPVAVLPPPVLEASALLPFDQTPLCQQEPLFPINMQRFCDTVLAAHCHGGDDTAPVSTTTAAEASPADDPFYDLELFLLSDSDY